MSRSTSSLTTPAIKADMLDRADILLRATSQARSRANDHSVETKEVKIGNDLLNFVFKPLAV
jgi:hypothetical protein